MSESIISQLDSLTPEELGKVGNLIGKFAGRHERNQDEKIPTKRKKRQKTKKRVDSPHQEVIVEHGTGRSKPRKRVIMPDEVEQPNERRSTGVGRSVPRNPQNQEAQDGTRRGRHGKKGTVRLGRGGGRVVARTETVVLTGDNKFLTSKQFSEERVYAKKDVATDKKLWSDNEGETREPSERPDKFEFAEVQCNGPCGLWFDINPDLILLDHDTGQPNFRCNDCSKMTRGQE